MKSIFTLLLFIVAYTSSAQVIDNKVHNIVMQLTVGDSTEQAAVVLQVANIRKAWPKANIEVVCQSGGLDMLTKAKSKVAKTLTELTAQGITFAVCNNTMTRRKITKEDLLPEAKVVPSAMVELVSKQEQGWSYLKAAH